MMTIADIHKNPFFYHIVIPAVAAVFPILAWGVFLPGARANYRNDEAQYRKAQEVITELLKADPDRLAANDDKGKAVQFDYATAVQQAAEFCSIGSGSYRLSSGIIVASGGQKSQSANVFLKAVDITNAARFLSTMHLRWSGLQCTKITLRKQKGLPDSWDAEFTFKYLY